MDAEREAKVDEIRATANKAKLESSDPLVIYLAGWLEFFIDQHRATNAAWARAIEAMKS